MADEKITVIDDKDREEEALSLCKWAAARAGVIVVVPGLGTLSTIANDIYMIMKIGSVYEEKITEKAAVSLLGSMGTVFAGGKLATLYPFLEKNGEKHFMAVIVPLTALYTKYMEENGAKLGRPALPLMDEPDC